MVSIAIKNKSLVLNINKIWRFILIYRYILLSP